MADVFGGLPKAHFGVIVADPPWRFKAGRSNRSTENHYATMPLDEIKALPVRGLAAEDCALFLWTTPPFLKQSMAVMDAWKFRYVSTGFVWLKMRADHISALFIDQDMFMSLGHTSRKSSEICLLGKRGRPKRINANVREVIIAGRRAHSQKPDQFYDRAQKLYPGPYLELFSRTNRPGWMAWGNETGKFEEAI